MFYFPHLALHCGSVMDFLPPVQRETVAWIILYALSGTAAYLLAGSDAFVAWLVIVTVSSAVLIVPNSFRKPHEWKRRRGGKVGNP